MKTYYFLIAILVSSMFISCSDCVECKYATLKGTEVEKFCSSTKEDREAFEARMEEEAAQNNSKAICEKVKY